MTYVGELGWELIVPVGNAGAGLRRPVRRRRDLGASNAGYYAIESLRLEKGYRAFGRELTPDYSPVEAGLVFATALKGDKDFLGREALEAHRDRLAEGGPRRRLVSFVLEDPEPMLWGGELLLRDGAPGRPGHQRRLGRDRRRGGRARLPALRRAGHRRLARGGALRGRRRRAPRRLPGVVEGPAGVVGD